MDNCFKIPGTNTRDNNSSVHPGAGTDVLPLYRKLEESGKNYLKCVCQSSRIICWAWFNFYHGCLYLLREMDICREELIR